jgi:hypothetical protein
MDRTAEDILLHYLDARINQRAGQVRAALKGTICIGVRQFEQTRWLVVRCEDAVRTSFADDLPDSFDAGIAVDSQTAMWILGAAPAPGVFHLRTGNLELLDTFSKRYLEHNDFISVRMGGGL